MQKKDYYILCGKEKDYPDGVYAVRRRGYIIHDDNSGRDFGFCYNNGSKMWHMTDIRTGCLVSNKVRNMSSFQSAIDAFSAKVVKFVHDHPQYEQWLDECVAYAQQSVTETE